MNNKYVLLSVYKKKKFLNFKHILKYVSIKQGDFKFYLFLVVTFNGTMASKTNFNKLKLER